MKAMVTVIVFLMTTLVFGQENKPVFEQEGEFVKATYFHANGNIAQTGFYLDGKLHGEWKMYDEEGKKIAMGQYDLGKKSGKWFFWEGKGLQEVDYSENQITSIITWKDAESMVLNK